MMYGKNKFNYLKEKSLNTQTSVNSPPSIVHSALSKTENCFYSPKINHYLKNPTCTGKVLIKLG